MGAAPESGNISCMLRDAKGPAPAHVIVLGNEKGGSGKSTTAMHIFVTLARADYKVGAIDLDTRQKSFFTYLENRKRTKQREGYSDRQLPMPIMRDIQLSDNIDRDIADEEELERFSNAVRETLSSFAMSGIASLASQDRER